MVAGETDETPVDEPVVAVDAEQLDTRPPTASTRTGSTGTTPAERLAATPLGSRYVLDRVIGSGATGRVLRGWRRGDDTPVAVKVLREELTRDPDTMVRFLRQRTVLCALDHPHLVRVHDLVAEGGVLAVVMDLVDGEDLRGLSGRQTLDTTQMLTLLGQVAEALAAVHAAGVVHRDIKPENVLVQWRDGQPYALLTDFGLAGAAAGPSDLTMLSQLLGTPAYVAPEVVTGRPAKPATDVYGLGVMAYELLTGERPFAAANTDELLHAHVETDPAQPPELAEPVWDLLRAMLAKDPTARPTAAEVATALTVLRVGARLPPPIPPSEPGSGAASHPPHAAANGDPSLAGRLGNAAHTGTGTGTGHDATQPTTGATRPAPATAPPTPPRRRRGLLVAAIATVSLLAAGAGLWFGQPLLADTPQPSQALPAPETPQPSDTPGTPPTSDAPPPSDAPGTPPTSDAPQPPDNPATSSKSIHTLAGHTLSVTSVAWSPDGAQLATASSDNTVQIWDAATGEHQRTLTGHTNWVYTVAWSPDGRQLATGSKDRTVRIWDAATGDEQRTLPNHNGEVPSVAWSPDGTYLATGSGDHNVRIWDAATGTRRHTLTGHTDWVMSVAWSPDGSQLATASADHLTYIWDAATGHRLRRLTGHSGPIRSVAWSPDGTRLATASFDATVRIWQAATGANPHTLPGHTDEARAVAWSPDGTRLASSGSDDTVRVWDAATGSHIDTLTGHNGWVYTVAWSPDSSFLATGSADNTARIWRVG